jgi:hypothetical protein
MDNFALFFAGIIITLISAMGVLVYCVSLGYKRPNYENKIMEKPVDSNADRPVSYTDAGHVSR